MIASLIASPIASLIASLIASDRFSLIASLMTSECPTSGAGADLIASDETG